MGRHERKTKIVSVETMNRLNEGDMGKEEIKHEVHTHLIIEVLDLILKMSLLS